MVLCNNIKTKYRYQENYKVESNNVVCFFGLRKFNGFKCRLQTIIWFVLGKFIAFEHSLGFVRTVHWLRAGNKHIY